MKTNTKKIVVLKGNLVNAANAGEHFGKNGRYVVEPHPQGEVTVKVSGGYTKVLPVDIAHPHCNSRDHAEYKST